MTRLEDLKLSELLPSSIRDIKEIAAIAEALDVELQDITKSINEAILLPRIDELPENVVDSLAWQLHVDFYEPLGLDINKKRSLVKNSLSWHRRKGTKSALEEIIKLLFLDDFSIQEWFEYGGNPYFFRLLTNENGSVSKERFYELIKAIYECKNERSWLEYIKINSEVSGALYTGGAITADICEISISQKVLGDLNFRNEIYVGGTVNTEASWIDIPHKTISCMEFNTQIYYAVGLWDVGFIEIPTKEIQDRRR